jgi:GNAT superfamily N-acetyltransferase
VIDPATIAAAIENHINAYLLSFACLPGAELRQDARCSWVDSGVPDVTFNAVVHANFGQGEIDAGIESVLSHFRRVARPVTWHVGPLSRPDDLPCHLEAHGMVHSEDEPGMAVGLDTLVPAPAIPAGLAIKPVEDEAGLRTWIRIWLFGAPEAIRTMYFEALRGRGIGGDLPWRYFVGSLDDEPAAISQLFTASGIASVQYVVTLPQFRRRGIGAAMTHRVLREGRDLGFRVAALTASPIGIGGYRRLGFREYCVFRRYEWFPG